MDFQSLGRLMLIIGLAISLIGAVIWMAGRFFNLGGLPGDIRIESSGLTCFVPIASMILLSIVLTIIINVILRLINRS
jgi:hypothetical protein